MLLNRKKLQPAHPKKAIINLTVGKPGAAATRPVLRRGMGRVEAAAYIGISCTKFDELRKSGRISRPRLIDGRKLWDVLELDADFEAFPVEGETEEDWKAVL